MAPEVARSRPDVDAQHPRAAPVERDDVPRGALPATAARSILPMAPPRPGRGWGASRAALLLGMQQGLGNRAVQRSLQRTAGLRPAPAVAPADDLAARIRHAPDGTPLAVPTQQRLEQALGADLSAVRVHTDGEADHLARAVDAVAFTTGPEIFFRSGAYQPSSSDGMRTLTHEVTHTLQQAAGPVAGTSIADGVAVSNPDDQFEQAATSTAAQIVSENDIRQRPEAAAPPAGPAAGSASSVQRATASVTGEEGEAATDDEDEEEEETEVRAGRRIAADEVVQRLPAGSATPRQPPPQEAAHKSLGLVIQRTDHKQPDPNSAYSDTSTVESAVYAVETQNDLIVYIGKTIQEDPNDRFKQHLQHPKKQHWKANNYKLDVWGEGDWTPWELATWEQWGIIAAGGRDSGLIENSINGITMDNYWHYKHLHSGRRKYKNLDKFTW